VGRKEERRKRNFCNHLAEEGALNYPQVYEHRKRGKKMEKGTGGSKSGRTVHWGGEEVSGTKTVLIFVKGKKMRRGGEENRSRAKNCNCTEIENRKGERGRARSGGREERIQAFKEPGQAGLDQNHSHTDIGHTNNEVG